MKDAPKAAAALEGAEVLISAGPAGVCMIPKAAWAGRPSLRAVADLNAVPPLGVEGVEVQDSGTEREGAIVYGALGVGSLKMKIHKACIAKLFERNDLVLDAETIAEVAAEARRWSLVVGRESLVPRVLIAGVSTRAAAESAVRAGFQVVTLDAYGDLDQPSECQTLPGDKPWRAAAAARYARAIDRRRSGLRVQPRQRLASSRDAGSRTPVVGQSGRGAGPRT